MHLNVGFSVTMRDYKIVRMDDVNPDCTIDDFKNLVAEKINYLRENLELAYRGKVLDGGKTLNMCGLNSGYVVNVLHKKEKNMTNNPIPISKSEIPELVRVFSILSTRNAFRGVLQKLSKPDVLENIISTTPGLREDPTAILILQHPELMAKLGDTDAVTRVVEQHPSLAHAASNLVAAVQNDMLSSSASAPSATQAHSSSNGIPFMVGSDDEDMELMISGDNQEQSSENQTITPRSNNVITPSQVAAALSTAAAAFTENNPAASSSSSSSAITPEMMSAALQQAIASTSSSSSTSSNSTVQTPSSIQPSQNNAAEDQGIITQAKLEELRKLGFSNDAASIQALQVANGDLQVAIHLLLNVLVDDS